VWKHRLVRRKAQDFYKAFGHDRLGEIGCDSLINQQDFLGVSFIAIQALEKRTAAHTVSAEELRKQNNILLNKLDNLTGQLNQLKEIVRNLQNNIAKQAGKK